VPKVSQAGVCGAKLDPTQEPALLIPRIHPTDLSLGTMNHETMVKNTALVVNRPEPECDIGGTSPGEISAWQTNSAIS
jgi:hypothetical protein